LLSKSSWGRLIPAAESDQNQIPNWTLAHDQLSWNKPEYVQYKDKVTGEMRETEVVSYWNYLEENYPVNGNDPAQNE